MFSSIGTKTMVIQERSISLRSIIARCLADLIPRRKRRGISKPWLRRPVPVERLRKPGGIDSQRKEPRDPADANNGHPRGYHTRAVAGSSAATSSVGQASGLPTSPGDTEGNLGTCTHAHTQVLIIFCFLYGYRQDSQVVGHMSHHEVRPADPGSNPGIYTF